MVLALDTAVASAGVRTDLRVAYAGWLRGKEDGPRGLGGEEGGQEGGQQPEEGRAQAGALMPLPQAEQDAERSSSGHRSFPDSTFYAI